MFKKLKDKIEEEFKQSPLRLSASVQQIAQVISPSSAANTSTDSKPAEGGDTPLPDALSVPADFFSICDEQEMGDASRRLHMVDLTANSPSIMAARSRRDSLSSVASDVSSLFPIYENPLNHSTLQSEWDSEIDESTSSQLDRVSKEHLYQGYKKLLYRYNKYKGRFTDLSRIHKDLQYEHIKTKNVLQESQDKALRRIAELREQCNLEQEAKAHLEESLRNDLEERDHVINTLNTKIGLLKGAVSDGEPTESTIDGCEVHTLSSENDTLLLAKNMELAAEVERLRKRLDESPSLPNGPSQDSASPEQVVKEKITQLKSGIVRMKSENENLSHLLSKSPSASDAGDDTGSLIDFSTPESDEKDKKIEKLSTILLKCKEKINNLNVELREKNASVLDLTGKVDNLTRDAIDAKEIINKLNGEIKGMKLIEEENVLTVAENKMAIHSELEAKEQQIKSLTQELEDSRAIEKEIKSKAEMKLSHYEQEILKLKDAVTKATEVKNDVLDKLRKQVGGEQIKRKESNTSTIDFIALERDKEQLDANMKLFLQRHQEKLNEVFNILETKVAKVEGNLIRLCADRLITSRATELELRQNISTLEELATNSGVENFKIEDLEKEVKILETAIEEKDKIIEEKSNMVEILNLELSEKIDRIVVLGAELEEVTEKHKLVLETLETKCENLKKLKSDSDRNYAQLQQELANVLSQQEALTLENSKHRLRCGDLERDNEIYQNKNHLLNGEVCKREDDLKQQQLCLERKEEEIASLRQKLNDSEFSANTIKLNCDQELENEKKLLENKLRQCEMENEKLEEELKRRIQLIEEERQEAKHNLNEVEKYKSVILEYEDRISTVSKDLELKNEEFETISAKLKSKDVEVEKLKMEISTIDFAKEGLSEKETEIDKQRRQYENIKFELEMKVENLKKETQVHVDELKNLREVLEETKVQFEVKSSEVEALKKYCEEKEVTHQKNVEEIDNKLKDVLEELAGANKSVSEKEAELEKARNKFEELNPVLEDKNIEIDELKQEIELVKNKNIEELVSQNKILSDKEAELERLKNEVQDLMKLSSKKSVETLETKLKSVIGELASRNEVLTQKESELEEVKTRFEDVSNEIKILKEHHNKEQSNQLTLEETEKRLKSAIEEKNARIENLMVELDTAKNELVQFQSSIDTHKAKLMGESDLKVNILKNEIQFLNDKFEGEFGNLERIREKEVEELRVKLDHSEKISAELVKKLEGAAAARDELAQICDEKSMKVTELSSCLTELKSDLDRNFNETSKMSNSQFEEIYESKLKKIVSDYETDIASKDERIRDIELQLSENMDALNSLQALRLELKNLRNELREKDDVLESKTEELEVLKKESENKIINAKIDYEDLIEVEAKKFEEDLRTQRKEFELRLENEKEMFQRMIEEERNEKIHSIEEERKKYEEKVKEFEEELRKERREWVAEKKSYHGLESTPSSEGAVNSHDLECTSKIAVAAVGSSTESIEMLRKEIVKQAQEIKEVKKQHKREVLELGKLAALRARRFSEREREGEDVEHEYLRNILYEYMMGREQMVLAKVLAAIVKFDQQQIHNILERQSSMGSLRIL